MAHSRIEGFSCRASPACFHELAGARRKQREVVVEECPDETDELAGDGDDRLARSHAVDKRLEFLVQALLRSPRVAHDLRWLPLLAPFGPPAMGPERVVMLLGTRDDVTPYAGGIALARDWQLPASCASGSEAIALAGSPG